MTQIFTKGPLSVVITDKDGYTLDNTTPLPVNPAESGAPNFATGQQAITASAAQIVAARAIRRAVLITNTHATNNLFVGAAAVTTATGQQVPPSQSISFPTTAAVYGIGSGNLTATFVEVYD
jgi:hypothetical protein